MFRSMKVFSAALLLLAATVVRAGNNLEMQYTNSGRLIVTPFASAPFPHQSRAEGHKYKDKLYPSAENYSDSTVAIFLPKNFRDTARVDFAIHFHGWNNTVAGTLSGFRLIEQFVGSGKNAILVVPEGPHNAPDSAGGKLEDQDGFKNFIGEVVATLQQRDGFKRKKFSLGRVILSGHSGGYRVISAILDRGGLTDAVRGVWLFDALYAETDKFLVWSERSHGRLLNIYTDHGGTKADSEAMMALLKKRGTPFLATEEAQLTPAELKNHRPVFIHTDLPHNDVVAKRNQFCLFLKTSALDDRKKSSVP